MEFSRCARAERSRENRRLEATVSQNSTA